MEPFNLPTLDGLHLIAGLCEGAFLGADSLAGFPSLKTLPYTAQLGYHHVNVFQSDSRNKSMVLHINNVHEGRKTSDIANELISKRTFLDWPFLQEGKVVAVSDHLFKHELIKIAGVGETVVATPHGSDALREWQRKSQGIEERYSKKTGVITGPIEVLLHIRPLKGLKRTEDGALIKDYEGKDKEREQAVQMSVSGVSSEDPRYLEKDAPPLHEDFPKGSKVFFLGDHAYGVAAQVSDTTDTSLSVVLAFFPSERAETQKLTDVVLQRKDNRYHPAYQVAQMLGLTGLGVSKITSSFMVLTADGSKVNVGLSIKFEAKSMKVLDYSRRGERGWEFSDKAVQLLKDYKAKFPQIFKVLDQRGDAMTRAADVFRDSNPDASVKAVKAWLNTQGVRDFEPVSLFSDHLPKEIVTQLEQLEDSFRASKTPANIKKAIVKGIPRQAVLKPAHAVYRLQNQRFELGDRVIMVQDTGGVPLTAKGVVIGLNSNSMEVVWDNAFLSGSTLSGRCSDYRGSTVTFNSCLNLTNPQFIASMNPQRQQQPPAEPFKPRFGPHPVVTPRGGRPPQGGFRPAPSVNGVPVHILANPNRAPPPARNANGSYGGVVSGNKPEPEPVDPSTSRTNALRDSLNEGFPNRGRGTNGRGRPPQNPNTRGGFVPNAHRREGSNTDRPPQVPVNNGRGRGNFMPNGDRGGRGFAPRGFRGRGRGRGAGAPPAIYSGTATISADT
ncbi:hypothetical protein SISSUDRAFT_114027 [Sistotremastrum suecicum HHB10207 ss-3]|nr:hypothetical protein SISSUDRAFT_114027 [Sistotremastrum suecicum HHB10207 ss-3]